MFRETNPQPIKQSKPPLILEFGGFFYWFYA